MAELIKCPACGKDVSDQAISCPNCGQPLKRNNLKKGKPLLTILLLIFLWPIGLIVMWATSTFSKTARIVITLLFIGAIIAIAEVGVKFQEISTANSETPVAVNEIEETTSIAAEKNNYTGEFDYRLLVENTIRTIYPDADFALIMNYRTWSDGTFTMVENQFKLNGIKHKYVARCGGEKIFHLTIDDEVVYYDEEGQWDFVSK